MGAQPVKLYTPLGEAWIDKVHQTKCTDHSYTINIHNKLIPLIKVEKTLLTEIIQFVSNEHVSLLATNQVDDKKAGLTIQLIESCIQRDLEEIIISVADPNLDLDQMHNEYKARLPTFDELASKYAIEYRLYEHDAATQFWFDGNLMRININDPCWLEFAKLKSDHQNGIYKEIPPPESSGLNRDLSTMTDYCTRVEEFEQQVKEVLAAI